MVFTVLGQSSAVPEPIDGVLDEPAVWQADRIEHFNRIVVVPDISAPVHQPKNSGDMCRVRPANFLSGRYPRIKALFLVFTFRLTNTPARGPTSYPVYSLAAMIKGVVDRQQHSTRLSVANNNNARPMTAISYPR